MLKKQLTLASLLLKWPPVIPLQGPDRAEAAWKRSGMAACWLVGWQSDWCCGKALPLCGARELERAQHLSSPFPLSVLGVGWGGVVNERKRTVIVHLHMLLIVDLGIFYEHGFTKQMLLKRGRGTFKNFSLPFLWAMN